MSDVFLSYARRDQALVEKIARCLIDAGNTVWWDSELLPHNRFASAIENEIRNARAVLVVWSETAVQSQWVRAEAELARAQDKLIQVALDQSSIPLPFNQFHVADLSRWRGDGDDAQWQKVLSSVSHFVQEPRDEAAAFPPAQQTPVPRTMSSSRSRRWLPLGAGALAAAALATTLILNRHPPESRGQRIAIQPFRSIGGTSRLQGYATQLSTSLQNDLTQAQFQTVPSTEVEAIQGDQLARQLKSLDVGLMFSGAVQERGTDVTVSMQLDDPVQHATLWTAEMAGKAESFDQIQTRVRALTIAVLNCSAQGLVPGARLTDDALQAFLHACELSETADHGMVDQRSAFAMLDAMRKAAQAAPDFAAAHSVLAKHLAFVMPWMPNDQVSSLRAEAEREAHRALELDPRDPDGDVALGLLTPQLQFAKREAFFQQALASNPAWPHANGFLGNVMASVGRLQDAATRFQRAAPANSLSVDWSTQSAYGMIMVGQYTAADRELTRLSQLWPDHASIWRTQLESMIAQGRWGDGLKLLDRANDFPTSVTTEFVESNRRLLSVLQSNGTRPREALRDNLLATGSAHPRTAISQLTMLGFIDDAFAIAQKEFQGNPDPWSDTEFLFRPETAALRRDPRFMALAAHFGLADYWRSSGHWADFCQDPTLPYSCSKEAAKYPPGPHP
ncbi:MAG: TIR domain-containing protein [Proteobacteria bacterium]|nr:TIR domain-containing protein [Pseudomonadota bacterium]